MCRLMKRLHNVRKIKMKFLANSPPSSIRQRCVAFWVWFRIVGCCRSSSPDGFLLIWASFPGIVQTRMWDRRRLCWSVVRFASSEFACDCRFDDDLWTFPSRCTSDPCCWASLVRCDKWQFGNSQRISATAARDRINVHTNVNDTSELC